MIGIKKEAAATGWVQVAREREPYRRGAMISAGRCHGACQAAGLATA